MNLNDLLAENIREDQRLNDKSYPNDDEYLPSAEINQTPPRTGLVYNQARAAKARMVELLAFLIHLADKGLTLHLQKLLAMIHSIKNEVKINSTMARALQITMVDILSLYYKPGGLTTRIAIQMAMAALYQIPIPTCWTYLVEEVTTRLYDTRAYDYRMPLIGPHIPNAIEHMFL